MRGRSTWRLLFLVVPTGFAILWIYLATASARVTGASAELRDPEGKAVGMVTLTQLPGIDSRVAYSLHSLPQGFHGFHVHVGGECDPANGFASTGGHYNDLHVLHPEHDGDLPNISVNDDGTAQGMLITDKFEVGDIVGMTVVVDDRPDNFGNVPVGDGPGQYTPNGPAAIAASESTGNSGPGIACGVITEND